MSRSGQSDSSFADHARMAEALLNAVPTALYVFDLVGLSPLFVSPRGPEMLGLDASDVEVLSSDFLLQTMHPDDVSRAMAHFAGFANAADGETRVFEYRMRAADGTWRWFRSNDVVFSRDTDSKPRQILGLGLDVTAEKAAEQALQESESSFRQLADALPQFVWVTEPDGDLSYVNARWTAFSGLDLAQTKDPAAMAAVYHPDDRDRVAAAWTESFASSVPLEIEARMRSQDGAYRWFLIRGVSVANGKRSRWFGTSTDVTAAKEDEIQLERLQTATAALSAAVTPAEVHRVAMGTVIDLEARAGALYEVHGDALVLTEEIGFEAEFVAQYRRIPLTAPIPLTDAVRTATPVWIRSRQDYRDQYPHLSEQIELLQTEAAASLPLVVDGRVLGALSFTFTEVLALDLGAQRFLETLASLTAQALERAHLYALAHAANERFDRAEAAANAFSYMWDLATDHVERSAGLRGVLGYAPEELPPTWEAWSTLKHPDDQRLTKAEAIAFLNAVGNEPLGTEYRVRHKDGTYRWLSERVTLIRDAAGRLHHVVGQTVDITERMATEDALRERERFVSAVANATPGLLYVYDLTTNRNLYVNDQFERLFGWTREDLNALGEGFLFQLIHPDDVAAVAARAERLADLPDGDVIEVDYRLRRHDGEHRWLRSRDTVFARDATGTVTQVLGMAEDVSERKQAEEALRRSEAIYRRLAEANLFGVGFGMSTGEVTFVNDEMLRMMGHTRTEFEAGCINWAAALAPEFQEAMAVEVQRVLTEGSASGYEAAFLRPDGGRTPYIAAAALIEPGEDYHVSIALDLTTIRAADAALRESEARFRTMADETPVIIWTTNTTGGIEFVNRAYTEFFGVTEAEVRGPHWQPLVHPDDVEAYVSAFLTALHDGAPFHAETRVRRADGEWRWIESFGAPRLAANGELLGMVGSSPDITERKWATVLLEQRQREFESLAEHLPDIVARFDRALRHTYVNAAAIEAIGLQREDFLGRTNAELGFPPDLVQRWDEKSRAAFATGEEQHFAFTFDGPHGPRSYEARVVPEGDLSGAIEAVLAVVTDVTERVRAEAERGAFLDALAHDVKNPLGAAKGRAQLARRQLGRGLTDPAKLDASLVGIDAAVNAATRMIDELLDVAHLRAGRSLQLRLAPTDLGALVQACAEETRQRSPVHEVRVDTESPALVGAWDAERLGRVLGNLLDNAVKYSPQGGEILVRVARTEDEASSWAEVAVTDQGIGIPAADLARIFERFHRGGNVARIAGTGIGLSGAKQIVEQHGGTIAVTSVEGCGSTFTVRLPL